MLFSVSEVSRECVSGVHERQLAQWERFCDGGAASARNFRWCVKTSPKRASTVTPNPTLSGVASYHRLSGRRVPDPDPRTQATPLPSSHYSCSNPTRVGTRLDDRSAKCDFISGSQDLARPRPHGRKELTMRSWGGRMDSDQSWEKKLVSMSFLRYPLGLHKRNATTGTAPS